MSPTEIIRFRDPALDVIHYLRRWCSNTYITVPEGWDWSTTDPLVIVTDTGGTGERSYVLDDAMLTIEVSSPDALTASETARTVHGLLRAWPSVQSGVYWRGTVMRPTYMPREDPRVPAYTMTLVLTFRAEVVNLTDPEIHS